MHNKVEVLEFEDLPTRGFLCERKESNFFYSIYRDSLRRPHVFRRIGSSLEGPGNGAFNSLYVNVWTVNFAFCYVILFLEKVKTTYSPELFFECFNFPLTSAKTSLEPFLKSPSTVDNK